MVTKCDFYVEEEMVLVCSEEEECEVSERYLPVWPFSSFFLR